MTDEVTICVHWWWRFVVSWVVYRFFWFSSFYDWAKCWLSWSSMMTTCCDLASYVLWATGGFSCSCSWAPSLPKKPKPLYPLVDSLNHSSKSWHALLHNAIRRIAPKQKNLYTIHECSELASISCRVTQLTWVTLVTVIKLKRNGWYSRLLRRIPLCKPPLQSPPRWLLAAVIQSDTQNEYPRVPRTPSHHPKTTLHCQRARKKLDNFNFNRLRLNLKISILFFPPRTNTIHL